VTWLGLLRRNLLRRRGRSLFTLLGVALAIASFLSLASLSRGMEDASRHSMEERGIDFVVVQRGMVEVFSSALPQALGADIARIPGVVGVAAELDTLLEINDALHVLVGGWDPGSFQWAEMPLLAGRRPVPGERGAVLGVALAERLGIGPGAEVTLNFAELRVTGVSGFENPLLRGAVQLPLPEMQALLGRPGQVSLFHVRLAPGISAEARATARAALSALRPDLQVNLPAEALRASKVIDILGRSSFAVALVALTMASLSVLNTVAMSVEERVREIGILAAIGWPRRRIIGLIMAEAVLLAGLGGLLGSALGILGNHLLVALVMRGSDLTVAAGARQVALGLGAALLVGGVGALWPAWRAARLSPAVALRRL
jgi:putative ABC transport system permease protein